MRQDVLLDEDGDLLDDGNGDFATGESVDDEVESLVLSSKGNWKEFPMAGFNIIRFINKSAAGTPKLSSRQKFVADLRQELDMDGLQSATITVEKDLSNFKIDTE